MTQLVKTLIFIALCVISIWHSLFCTVPLSYDALIIMPVTGVALCQQNNRRLVCNEAIVMNEYEAEYEGGVSFSQNPNPLERERERERVRERENGGKGKQNRGTKRQTMGQRQIETDWMRVDL